MQVDEKMRDAIYLQASDIGTEFTMVQDNKDATPEQTKYGGVSYGMRSFAAQHESPLAMVMDIRWVFPDSKSAMSFLEEFAPSLGEGLPKIQGAPVVGDGSLLLGGEGETLRTKMAGLGGITRIPTMYCYLFASGCVVGKVFATQGSFAAKPLTPDMLLPIANRAADICRSVRSMKG